MTKKSGIAGRIPAIFALVLGLFSASYGLATNAKSKNQAEFISGQYVVQFKKEMNLRSGSALDSVLKRLNESKFAGDFSGKPFLTSGDHAVIESSLQKSLSPNQSDEILKTIQKMPEIEIAERNYIYRTFSQPNDPQFSALWGLKNTGQADSQGNLGKPGADIGVTAVWDEGRTGSKNIVVAVIDTGANFAHQDLKGNLIAGYDFVNNDADATDDQNHGSHCSGTIGAKGNNNLGVVGVNWNVTIMPIKFLAADGSGSLSGAVQSIQFATQKNVNIMSNSWGGGGYSDIMKNAIIAAKDKGILFVAAAGNNTQNTDMAPSYPASYDVDNIVSVAATNNKDQLASFSNYGRQTVHVAAPGVNIISTNKDGGYMNMSGTSMACPHVSGIAALIMASSPGLNYLDIKNLLINSSDKVASLRRASISGGRVNVYNALHGIYPPAPAEPKESDWQDSSFSWESVHPYANNLNESRQVQIPGARHVRVWFEKVDTEASYDFIQVSDSQGNVIENISGQKTDYATDYVNGDTVNLKFKSDSSVNSWGFRISKVQAVF